MQTRNDRRSLQKLPNNYVYLGDSSIHGIGVFAKREISASTYLGYMDGEHISEEEYNRRYPDDMLAEYVLELKETIIDTINPDVSTWHRYLNDYRIIDDEGYVIDNKTNKFSVKFNEKAELFATRDIKKGEELLLDYGKFYFLEK